MRGRRWKKSALPEIEEEAEVKNSENVAILPLQTDLQHTNKNRKTNWPQKKTHRTTSQLSVTGTFSNSYSSSSSGISKN